MKNIGIWFIGLLASGVTGALIGERFDADIGAAVGASVGVMLFTCYRAFMPK